MFRMPYSPQPASIHPSMLMVSSMTHHISVVIILRTVPATKKKNKVSCFQTLDAYVKQQKKWLNPGNKIKSTTSCDMPIMVLVTDATAGEIMDFDPKSVVTLLNNNRSVKLIGPGISASIRQKPEYFTTKPPIAAGLTQQHVTAIIISFIRKKPCKSIIQNYFKANLNSSWNSKTF